MKCASSENCQNCFWPNWPSLWSRAAQFSRSGAQRGNCAGILRVENDCQSSQSTMSIYSRTTPQRPVWGQSKRKEAVAKRRSLLGGKSVIWHPFFRSCFFRALFIVHKHFKYNTIKNIYVGLCVLVTLHLLFYICWWRILSALGEEFSDNFQTFCADLLRLELRLVAEMLAPKLI